MAVACLGKDADLGAISFFIFNILIRGGIMDTQKTILGLIMCVIIALTLAGCGGASHSVDSATVRYLSNNIHAQQGDREIKASYANWTDPGSNHIIIPVNTPVKIDTVRRDLSIETMDTKMTIFFEFNEGNMGMTNEQYINLISSPQPVVLDRLSHIDRKGIKEGKVHKGMTKEGVRIALGYPARHKTPTLEVDTWYYWLNRFNFYAVEFDRGGKVIRIIK
jgi:hypothetical protein